MGILDKLGQPITEGCYVVYGHALGRCAALKIGKILEVHAEEQTDDTGWKKAGEMNYSFTVQGVDDDGGPLGDMKLTRKGRLLYSDRIIVLPKEMVPEKYLALLG